MKTDLIKLSLLVSNNGQVEGLPKNPRFIKDERFSALVKFIFFDPEMLDLRELIVYPHQGKFVIIAGNMRYRAMKELGYAEAPCKILPEETPIEKLRAYTIKDNNSFGENDFELLAKEWDLSELKDFGMDFSDTDIEESTARDKKKYSTKIGTVIYEPKQTNHSPKDLFVENTSFDKLIEEIENEDLRKMLRHRASYFTVFNYSKIADYYAYQATDQEKRIFEKMALVLLDKDQLIENGFSKIAKEVLSHD